MLATSLLAAGTSFAQSATGRGRAEAIIEGNSGFSISARVPVLCKAELVPSSLAAETSADLGQINLRCNAAAGYRIYMDYPPGVTDVSLMVDDREVRLDGSGRVLLIDADVPQVRQIRLQTGATAGDASLSSDQLRLEAPAPKH